MSNFLILDWTVLNSYLTFKSGETYLTFQKNIIFGCSVFRKWLNSQFLAKNDQKRPEMTSRGKPCGKMRVLEGCSEPRNYRKPIKIGYITSIIGLFPVIMSFASLNIMKYHENEHGTYSHMEHWFRTHSCSKLLTVNILGTHFIL